MAHTVSTHEPTQLVIGSAWAWDPTYSDYPADESWQLAYFLRGHGDLDLAWAAEVTAGTGAAFSVRVPRTTTDNIAGKPGKYRLTGRVFKALDDEDGVVVYSGHLLVLADPATAVNVKSHNRLMLAAIDAALLKGVSLSAEAKAISINGRSIQYRDSADLEGRRAHYALLVALEDNPYATVSHEAVFVRG